jgi:hypothetical protein
VLTLPTRIIEAFVGEYASGKSENAINRALDFLEQQRNVVLVDLDLVEPFYTLRPLKEKLTATGLKVIAWSREDALGFGETGTLLKAETKGVLRHPGDIIFDVGYGVGGANALNLIEGLPQNEALKVYLVVNIARPMTATVSDIIAYGQTFPQLDGLINNTHLGSETTPAIVQAGALLVKKAAIALGVPFLWTSALAPVAKQLGAADCTGTPIHKLTRFMEAALF